LEAAVAYFKQMYEYLTENIGEHHENPMMADIRAKNLILDIFKYEVVSLLLHATFGMVTL
jgi:hypothetical protein